MHAFTVFWNDPIPISPVKTRTSWCLKNHSQFCILHNSPLNPQLTAKYRFPIRSSSLFCCLLSTGCLVFNWAREMAPRATDRPCLSSLIPYWSSSSEWTAHGLTGWLYRSQRNTNTHTFVHLPHLPEVLIKEKSFAQLWPVSVRKVTVILCVTWWDATKRCQSNSVNGFKLHIREMNFLQFTEMNAVLFPVHQTFNPFHV